MEKHISLIQRERLSTMRLMNCSSENNTHSSRKTVTYIYDMRPTIHSQEYPIKFNLKLPFQLRKKEEEQKRLMGVNIDGYKKRNWGQCIFDNIV